MDFYSKTLLDCFNAPEEFSESGIKLPYCSFIRPTEEQLNECFAKKQGDSEENTTLPLTMQEKRVLRDKFFLCFNTQELHDKHFQFVSRALRFLYKFHAMTAKTFLGDEARGSLGKRIDHHGPLQKPENDPEFDVRWNFHRLSPRNPI